jgi:hypothetical protein
VCEMLPVGQPHFFLSFLLNILNEFSLVPQHHIFLDFPVQFGPHLPLQRYNFQLHPFLFDHSDPFLVLFLHALRILQLLKIWSLSRFCSHNLRFLSALRQSVNPGPFLNRFVDHIKLLHSFGIVLVSDGLDVQSPLGVFPDVCSYLSNGVLEVLVDDFDLDCLFAFWEEAGTGLGGQTKGFVGEVDGRAEVCFFVHLLILLCSRGLLVYRGKIRPDGGGID